MLQSNLIFGIQKKIKERSAKFDQSEKEVLEESSLIDEPQIVSRAEPMLESSFIAGMYQKTESAKKKKEVKGRLVTESFHMAKVQRKLEKDITYFNYLYENFVEEAFKEQYMTLLESLFEDTINLYKECDVTPRLISLSLDTNELSENQVIDIYKNSLNENIKNNYTKALLSGTITELYENELRILTRGLIEEGSEISAEQVKVYLPFEENLYKFNKNILVPKAAQSKMDAFMESMTEEYLLFIEESAQDMLQNMEKKVRLMTSMVSPKMFEKVVDTDGIEGGVDASKMAGITIAIDKNFDTEEEDGGCSMDAVAGDLEAQEEIADEEEATDIENANEDLVQAEEETREDMDMATSSEDYEDIPKREEEAEESASEETLETGDQPGAVELDLKVQDETNGDGESVNKDDVALQGTGNDNGEDPAIGAQLPGGGEAVGTEIDSDDSESSEEELEDLEDTSSDTSDIDADDIEPDDKKMSDDELSQELDEATTQDKKPKAQTGKVGVKKTGSMPGGQTDNSSKPGPQGAATSKTGTMPSGKTTQDNKPKAQNTSGNSGTMPAGKTGQDTNI